jgi:hypothetical protein
LLYPRANPDTTLLKKVTRLRATIATVKIGGKKMISDVEKVLKIYYDTENRKRLTPSAFAVLVTLAMFNRGILGISQMSLRRIGGLIGISKRTVIRALNELHQKEFLMPLKSHVKTQRPMAYLLLPERGGEKDGQDHPDNNQAPGTIQTAISELEDILDELGDIF